MELSNTNRKKILDEILSRRANFTSSDAKFAASLGIAAAQFSRIKNGELERVVSDAQWISFARKFGVSLKDGIDWNIANTPVMQFVCTQLKLCQENALSVLMCDLSDIGKTFSARYYVKTNKNVVYVDCGQVKSKQKLIRCISQELGVNSQGKYSDVYDDLVFTLKNIENPLIILDEAGDLDYKAFLEIKALWNATENYCGWYMIGADGLKALINRNIGGKKVGYTEMFSRFGKRFSRIIPTTTADKREMLMESANMIIVANCGSIGSKATNQMLNRCIGEDGLTSLRRIYKEIIKSFNS